MLRQMMKSKIHKANITDAKLNYNGSIGIDKNILKKADILQYEKVHVLNYNTGVRFETYAIEEKAGSGSICLYGPAAKMGKKGQDICILTYAAITDKEAKSLKPKVVRLDNKNRLKG